MGQTHILEKDAIRDFGAVLAKLDAGETITIDREGDALPVHLVPHRTLTSTMSIPACETAPSEELRYLSEFRELHPEPLDGSSWD